MRYMEHDGCQVSRAQFESNLALKLRDPAFLADINPLLATDYRWEPQTAALVVAEELLALLPG